MILLHLQSFSWPVPEATIQCVYLVFIRSKKHIWVTESLLWTFTFTILNQVWQLQWKIFTAVYIYYGGAFGREKAFSLIPHPSQQLFKKLFITHKRKKKKTSRSRLHNVPRTHCRSSRAANHGQVRHMQGVIHTDLCRGILAVSTVIMDHVPGATVLMCYFK